MPRSARQERRRRLKQARGAAQKAANYIETVMGDYETHRPDIFRELALLRALFLVGANIIKWATNES